MNDFPTQPELKVDKETSQSNPVTAKSGLTDVDLLQVVVIIPALNEEASLPLVLDDLPNVGNVVVVNNGSNDRTADIARDLGATVIDEPNRGYGTACIAGIAEANRWSTQQQKNGSPFKPIVVFVDADYSDHVHLLPSIVEPIFTGQFDFVLGSRLQGKREKGAMPPQSVYGNKFACAIMNLLFRSQYTDLGPFRALRLDVLNQLKMEDLNYGWTIEMQIKASKKKLRVVEIPVPYRKRLGVSKISGTVSGTFKAGAKILYSIWRYY